MAKKTDNSQSVENMMCEALLRSGYVMESRIVHSLAERGFFVESNQRVADPVTGKSREIDLVAELYDSVRAPSRLSTRVCVTVRFVCEAKNNSYPVVLLTELPFSPNLATWESLHEGRTGFFKTETLDPSLFDFLTDGQKLYTQYCSFKPKKNEKGSEWLAWHPDDFHDDLEKIVTYCRAEAEQIGGLNDDFHRLFVYVPVVILSGDLYLAIPENAKVVLSKVASSLHMHFGMHKEMQCSSLVLFVTEGNCLSLFDKIIRFGQSIESTVIQKTSSEEGKS